MALKMDNKLTYKDLKNMANLAKEKNLCLAVEVTIPGQEETEIIINRSHPAGVRG